MGFGLGSVFGGFQFPTPSALDLSSAIPLPHYRGMSILAVDPETQAHLQWSASQPGFGPGDFGSDRDSNR